MRSLISYLIVAVAFMGVAHVAYSAKPEAADGKVRYFKWNMPDTPDGDTSTDVTGTLGVSGDAAELMYNHMVNARFSPGASDLENRTPDQISRTDCPSRVGTHVICRKLPEFTKDGNSLKRDKDGRVVYDFQCDINIVDTSRGEFRVNQ